MKHIARVMTALLIAWVLFSWVDIASDNRQPNPQHSNLNFFMVMFPSGAGEG